MGGFQCFQDHRFLEWLVFQYFQDHRFLKLHPFQYFQNPRFSKWIVFQDSQNAKLQKSIKKYYASFNPIKIEKYYVNKIFAAPPAYFLI